jgi:transposase
MWTPTTRRQHSRDHLRYGSDLTDQEWEILASFMPPAAKTGRPRSWAMREIMNAIFYVLRAGCAWSLLPKDFPPRSTPRRWVVERFHAWVNRNRRLAKDFEATIASAQAFLYAASVMLLTRRLARSI